MLLIRPKSSPFSLLEIIAQGEGLCTEFKRLIHSPARIARSIASFANTSGGCILIGVDDDQPDKPHVHIEETLGRQSGLRSVERRVFIREGSHNKAASDDRIALIRSEKKPLQLSFSDRERRLLRYLAEHSRITAPEFAEHAGIPVTEARLILVSLVRTGTIRLLAESGPGVYALA